MTISSEVRKAGPFTGNDVTTAFPFTFKVFAAADVSVVQAVDATGVETTLVLNTDYTVSLNADQNSNPGGTVTLVAALATGYTLVVTSAIENLQPTDLTNQGGFYPRVINDALDRATIQLQQLQEQVDRSAKLPITNTADAEALVADLIRVAESANNLDTVAGSIANVNTVASDIANVNTVAGSIANVNATGANIAAVVTVADDLNEPVSEIETVAGSIANVNTVGANIANVNTVAGISANVTAVAGVASDIPTVAANVTDITNFSDVYLGARATDPATRTDGSALQTGDLYFNTADNALRAYSGTVWVAGTAGTVSVQMFSGDDATTVFALATAPASENNTQVYIGGVYQNKDTYSVSGTTLTFSEAPVTGTNNIEVVTIATLALGETDANLVSYTPAGTGAVATNVQDKLREFDRGGALVNEFGLMAAHDAFRKLETTATSGPFYVGITGYGDSMADPTNYTIGVIGRALQMRYGLGGLFTPFFGQSWIGATWTFTGGATQPRNDWTYLPGANQINMPAGSTAQISTTYFAISGSTLNDGTFPTEYNTLARGNLTPQTIGFRKVRCFYITRPGDGDLTFTVSQTGSSYSPVVVSCNAALGLSYTDITVLDEAVAVTLNVAASTATCLFVGAVFLRETGVLMWSSQVGGSTMEQQKTYITNGNVTTIYKPLCEALSTAMFIHAQRVPGDANWQNNYVQVFDALDTIPGTSQFVLGEPPRLVEDSPTVPVINDYLLTQCLSRGYAYYDQYRALGSSNSVLTTLGWGDADGVHLDPPAWRYLAGKILKEVDWFRIGGNKLDADPLTMAQLLRRLAKLQGLMALRSSTIYGRAGATIDGGTTAGGFTYSADNSKGFNFNSAAALGHSAGRLGNIISNSPSVTTSVSDVYVALVGYRNLSLPAGVRAFGLIGVTSTFSTLTTLNQRCFGFECAKGSDVGSPGGVTTEVVRLLVSDGTTITYGPWVQGNAPGTSVTSQTGLNILIGWSRQRSLLTLYRQAYANFYAVSTLPATDLAANNTAGGWFNVSIVAEDAGNVPATTGYFTVNEVKTNFSPTDGAFNTCGIAGNDIMQVLI